MNLRESSPPALFLVLAVALLAVAASPSLRAVEPALREAPLAPRSGPRGATMFASVPSAQSGVVTENNYADPRMWTDHYQELAYGAIGTGVTIGDYDNDGRPDIFVVSKTERCRLSRNLGNWKFEDATDRAGVVLPSTGDAAAVEERENWKQGATFVDVNNDGWLDLYVCRFDAPNLLYINQRNGTFREEGAPRGLAVKDASGMAAFCDFDRDGWLDAYVQTSMLNATTHPTGQRDHLFRNRGDGTFVEVSDQAGIKGETAGHSAIWWDFDDDGWPDLYVANDYAAPDHLYHNNHDGTFSDVLDRTMPHTPYYSMGSDFGDVNNDGLFDFFAADMAASSYEKDQRGMAGSRARAQMNPTDPSTAPQYMRNALYVNTGTGRFLEAANLAGLAATDWTWSPRLEDLDNDGRLDLHVTNGMTREYHNADLLERIMAVENPADSRQVVRSSPVLAETNFAFRNLGDLNFKDVSGEWGLGAKGVSFGSALGDLDGDGDLDLVYGNYLGTVTLLRNDSDSGHRLVIELRGQRSNRFGVGAKVRLETAHGIQVRSLVLARGALSASEPIIHFGLGDESSVARLTVTWPTGAIQEFTQLNADRRLTITEPLDDAPAAEKPGQRATPQFADVSGIFDFSLGSNADSSDEPGAQPLLPRRLNGQGPALAVGDLSGDGHDDVVLGGTPKDPAKILSAGNAGHFTASASLNAVQTRLEDGPILILDADGDGANDVLVARSGAAFPSGVPAYQPQLYINDGHGQLRPAPEGALPAIPISAGATVAADFDRDGRLDVFLGGRVKPKQYPLAPRSALLQNRGGRFEDLTDALAPGLREVGMVTSALWSDVDGDGWLDLLIALEWGGIRYWHNRGGAGFEDWSEKVGFGDAGTGWWNSIAAADFNGDGRIDYAVGNVGLNTPYEASPDRPALLFYGSFAAGAPQLIEAYYEGDRLRPRRTRQELGAKVPTLLKRFPKNDAFARATLAELLGEDRLAAARRFAATEFRSGVFLSQPNGAFQFQPLPRLAQLSSFHGLAAGDFDGDGHADIYGVQNDFTPIAAVGRFDGGLSQLLRGNGHGEFEAIAPRDSNLLVPGDARALVVADLDEDGWPDFLISRNSSSTLAYRNAGVAARHSFRVQLKGPPGNRTAIGARVSLELVDGSTQTAEVYAGSGYLSQSTSAVFFGFPEGNAPRQLLVHWPSGQTSRYSGPFTAPTIVVTVPSTTD